jgi:hypothetical protein
MKIWREEFGHDYQNYRFGFSEWAEYEAGDSLDAFYEKGYLPYSKDPDIAGRFYLARSARVPLDVWEPNSENRRIFKKFENHTFERTKHDTEYIKHDQGFRDLFLAYFKKKHGDVMPASRLDGILNTPLPLVIYMYSENHTPIGYVLQVEKGHTAHYWFSAYTLAFNNQHFGMWMMIDAVQNAKKEGRAHLYLGTVYGEKALYKTNFTPLEWFNGTEWVSDIKTLKSLARNDS